MGCGVRPLFPGRAEEEVAIESGFGNGSRVSADWRVSEGVGVGRGRGRWTDGCLVAARGWGFAEDPPLDWGLS